MSVKRLVAGRTASATVLACSMAFSTAAMADPEVHTSMMHGGNGVDNPVDLNMGSDDGVYRVYLPGFNDGSNPSENYNFDGTLSSGEPLYNSDGEVSSLSYVKDEHSPFYYFDYDIYTDPTATTKHRPYFESAFFCFSKNRDPHRDTSAHAQMGPFQLLDCDHVVQVPIHHVGNIPDEKNNCENTKRGTYFTVTGLLDDVEDLTNNICYDIGINYTHSGSDIFWSGRSACTNFTFEPTADSCGESVISHDYITVDLVQDEIDQNVYHCNIFPLDHTDATYWTIQYHGADPNVYKKEGRQIDISKLDTYDEGAAYDISCTGFLFLSDQEYVSSTISFEDRVDHNNDGVSEVFYGGAGYDVLIYDGDYEDYEVTMDGPNAVFIDRNHASGLVEQDRAYQYERIEFANGYIENGEFNLFETNQFIYMLDGSISPYASDRQHSDMSYIISEDHRSIMLTGNTWLKQAYVEKIYPESVLRVEYRGTASEITAIGVDTDDNYENFPPLYSIDNTQNVPAAFDVSHKYTGNGDWQTFEIPLNFEGEIQHLVFVNDNDDAESDGYSEYRNIFIYHPDSVAVSGGSPYIDFSKLNISEYVSAQNENGVFSLVDEGEGIEVENNGWPKVEFSNPYRVKSNTTLQFDFCPEVFGEIHAIGLDNDNDFRNDVPPFAFAGSEVPHVLFINDAAQYNGTGECQRMRIDLGAYLSGQSMPFLTMVNDHDQGAKNAKATFRRVALYEDSPYFNMNDLAGDFMQNVTSYSGGAQDQPESTFSIDLDGRTITVEGNGWKKWPLQYSITKNTVLEYQMYVEVPGEIQGLSLDSDDNYKSGPKVNAIYVGQELDQYFDDSQSQNVTGRWVTVQIPIGETYPEGLDVKYMTIVNDDDDGQPNAKAMYRDIILYEKEPDEEPMASNGNRNVNVSDLFAAVVKDYRQDYGIVSDNDNYFGGLPPTKTLALN